MSTVFRIDKNKRLIIIEILLVLSGISIFAWFIHGERFAIGAALGGLILAFSVISLTIFRSESVFPLFGLGRMNKKILVYSFIGVLVGVISAFIYRTSYRFSPFPDTLTVIAIISPTIGITEELVFRGYIQGRIKPFGSFFSVFLSAAGHSLYKYLVLKSSPVSISIDLPLLVLFTFIVGVIIGTLRDYSRSVLPAMIAHASFDIIVYGDLSEMPVWVWT